MDDANHVYDEIPVDSEDPTYGDYVFANGQDASDGYYHVVDGGDQTAVQYEQTEVQ